MDSLRRLRWLSPIPNKAIKAARLKTPHVPSVGVGVAATAAHVAVSVTVPDPESK